jgi:hypothetical protein
MISFFAKRLRTKLNRHERDAAEAALAALQREEALQREALQREAQVGQRWGVSHLPAVQAVAGQIKAWRALAAPGPISGACYADRPTVAAHCGRAVLRAGTGRHAAALT